ncbi:MAG: TetR family transcriptional regulator [Desulfobacteraceae bacterium]|nr:TetR family transcriptional regulator [Desulfobacteraceae bacterium]
MPAVSMKNIIRQAAIDLFYRKGYFAASISEIAAASGIRKASLYHHYESKEALLFAILKETMDDLMAHLTACLKGVVDVEVRMRAAVRGHVQFHLHRQKENFIANSELRGLTAAHYQEIVRCRDAYERVFQEIIGAGRRQGVFAPGDDKILSYAILTLCTAGASWFKPSGRLRVDEIAEIYENFIISGLKRAERETAGGFADDSVSVVRA